MKNPMNLRDFVVKEPMPTDNLEERVKNNFDGLFLGQYVDIEMPDINGEGSYPVRFVIVDFDYYKSNEIVFISTMPTPIYYSLEDSILYTKCQFRTKRGNMHPTILSNLRIALKSPNIIFSEPSTYIASSFSESFISGYLGVNDALIMPEECQLTGVRSATCLYKESIAMSPGVPGNHSQFRLFRKDPLSISRGDDISYQFGRKDADFWLRDPHDRASVVFLRALGSNSKDYYIVTWGTPNDNRYIRFLAPVRFN